MIDSKLRDDALAVFEAGLEASDGAEAVRRHLRREGETLWVAGTPYDLEKFDSIRVIGMGKASAVMATPLAELLGDRLAGGIINVKYGYACLLPGIRVNEAGHPLPDLAGQKGTQDMIRLLTEGGGKDLVFCLMSGGGSALAPAPAEGLSLKDKQEVTQLLLECGADIHDVNAIRKHLSALKGGRMARLAVPATLVSLILSDVMGDDLDTIASGPTVPDRSTYFDCLRIMSRFGIRDLVPPHVLHHLESGARGELPETPKSGDPAFHNTHNVVVGSNALALEAARRKAVELGYNAIVLSSSMEGEAREVARVHAAVAREILGSGSPVPPPACVISGGETTVTIRGKGTGGRNQEFALAAALRIQGLEGVVILSGGTDGTDGPTRAAGALADGTTVERARVLGIDALASLDDNDSFHVFEPLGDLLMTGPTHTNVMDLRLVLVN